MIAFSPTQAAKTFNPNNDADTLEIGLGNTVMIHVPSDIAGTCTFAFGDSTLSDADANSIGYIPNTQMYYPITKPYDATHMSIFSAADHSSTAGVVVQVGEGT